MGHEGVCTFVSGDVVRVNFVSGDVVRVNLICEW